MRRRRGRRRERRVDLLVIVAGGDGERFAVIRRCCSGRGRRRRSVMMVVPGRGVSVQCAYVVMGEERVHVVRHVVGHQRLVPARRRRPGRRLVPAPVMWVMVVVMMSPGTADHFHAGSHFHAAIKRSSGCDTLKIERQQNQF